MPQTADGSTQIDGKELRSNQKAGASFTVTHRLVLSIAIPMTIGHLTTPLMGLVDTAVIGQLGVAALIGGLAVGTILVNIAFFTFNFLRSGTVGLTAQAFGAGDEIEMKAALARALCLSLIIGILLVLVSPLLLSLGLWFMMPSEATAEATKAYFQIRMLSAPFALANYALFGWFIGRNATKTALFLQLIINGTNIILSIILGLILEWGISGVATATVLAETLGAFIGLAIAWRSVRAGFRPTWAQISQIAAIKKMMSMNGDIMIRSFALLFAFGYFTAQGAKFGENVLAANAILLHFFFVGGYFLDGLAISAEQISGRAIGAGDRRAFVRAAKLTITWSFFLAACLALIFLAAGESAIDFITTSLSVRQDAKEYFLWAALISIAGVGAFVMDGIYIGSTWSRSMSVTMVVSLIGFIGLWTVVAPFYGNNGLWFSFYCFLLLRGITMAALLPRNIRRTFD